MIRITITRMQLVLDSWVAMKSRVASTMGFTNERLTVEKYEACDKLHQGHVKAKI